MLTEATTFTRWVAEARVAKKALTSGQGALLQFAFQFLEHCGRDYYSQRLLGHFLLHCQSGFTIAAVARLLGITRAAASGQQKLSSKEVVQAAYHRLKGRSHGKLLPRYAGPIAEFLLKNPKTSRFDLLDFIEATWGVSVSRMALHKFLKKYGLDQVNQIASVPTAAAATAAEPGKVSRRTGATELAAPSTEGRSIAAAVEAALPSGEPVPLPARDFFLAPPTTREPFSSYPMHSTGSPRPKTASRMRTGRCDVDC
jgi:hypothetical protein